ncbi:hypothetical protein ACOMHN_061593 [Nucella lapillus]
MEVSDEKSKTFLNSTSNLAEVNIKLNGQKLKEVDNFKYIGSIITKDGSSIKESRTRLSLASPVMTKLVTFWKSNTISLPVKIRLYKSLVLSILLYGCETWTLLKLKDGYKLSSTSVTGNYCASTKVKTRPGMNEGGRRKGRQRKAWVDIVKELTGETFNSMLQTSEDRDRWRAPTAVSSMAPQRRQSRD